eukprot:scaffold5452_cov127-Isochrysis_galbana.AAC.5
MAPRRTLHLRERQRHARAACGLGGGVRTQGEAGGRRRGGAMRKRLRLDGARWCFGGLVIARREADSEMAAGRAKWPGKLGSWAWRCHHRLSTVSVLPHP